MIDSFSHLLREFEQLPRDVVEPTYLDICRYPRRRFEEITSRVLAFYFSPTGEHRLGDLFLRTLLECLSKEQIPFKTELVKVTNEECAEDKRIDILINAQTFVIGIENKIGAALYNPLDKYSEHILQYSKTKAFKVVLSLKKISQKYELEVMGRNGFVNLTYEKFFQTLKMRMGDYLIRANSKYVTFLLDFIQTIENMNSANVLNEQLQSFFFDNSERIQELKDLFEKYEKRILDIQIQQITQLKAKIEEHTKSKKWWAFEGWDLGVSNLNPQFPQIGLESYFIETRESALGKFEITYTAWNLKDWAYFEDRIMMAFPGIEPRKDKNRVFFKLEEINENDEEKILSRLKYYFSFLNDLVQQG